MPDGSDGKLACRGIWKLFGPDARRFLEQHEFHPSMEQITQAGLIGAVQDVTFEVADGEIFIIMGLSGSGKSTLVRCMSRLIEPTAGEALFDGQDLIKTPEKELIELRRHKMGMVFQHFALLPHLTVLHNVAFPLEIQGVDRRTREQRAREVIDLVGLGGREQYYPRELSGGQQQRVGIARSLSVEPDVWFLDEPFSALDPLIRREMQDEFLRLQNLLRKTIMFITHDFDEAIRLADRIAIMKDGIIEQIGTPEEVVTAPATDYVAEFTKEVPRQKVLSVRSIMSDSAAITSASGEPVSSSDRIETVAARVFDQETPVPVADASGKTVGVLTRDAVIEVLVRRTQ